MNWFSLLIKFSYNTTTITFVYMFQITRKKERDASVIYYDIKMNHSDSGYRDCQVHPRTNLYSYLTLLFSK
jgi:hypothetical protein